LSYVLWRSLEIPEIAKDPLEIAEDPLEIAGDPLEITGDPLEITGDRRRSPEIHV